MLPVLLAADAPSTVVFEGGTHNPMSPPFGFLERVYLPAAQMLHHLGFRKVRLMTNNPQKVAALSRFGIAVEERVGHSFPSNGHNDFYLATKAQRFGHLF